jgi:hypothetical protein
MQHLADEHGVNHECFASPLNAWLPSFCSVFPDTDTPFGSLGSFFNFDFGSGGAFQVGPPYNNVVLLWTAEKLVASLMHAEQSGMFHIPYHKLLASWLSKTFCKLCLCKSVSPQSDQQKSMTVTRNLDSI